MKAIAQTLRVARSNLIERIAGHTTPRDRYQKAADAELLPLIRAIVDARPTYGYRRVGAVLNRRLALLGKAAANHKRVFRIMQLNGLLLQPYTGRRDHRVHDGSVQTVRSNLRWCSDGFEIHCWNGAVVRVAFSLDTCDREAMAWAASTAGVSGEMIRDIMLLSVERRFGTYRTPHPIEWLADNGSGYTADDTVNFAIALGLAPCFTPVRSPESNGMAEAFVKTFKRDYVRCNPCPDAASVLRQLPVWFEDYNNTHPHRALKMRAPREFIQANSSPATCPVS